MFKSASHRETILRAKHASYADRLIHTHNAFTTAYKQINTIYKSCNSFCCSLYSNLYHCHTGICRTSQYRHSNSVRILQVKQIM